MALRTYLEQGILPGGGGKACPDPAGEETPGTLEAAKFARWGDLSHYPGPNDLRDRVSDGGTESPDSTLAPGVSWPIGTSGEGENCVLVAKTFLLGRDGCGCGGVRAGVPSMYTVQGQERSKSASSPSATQGPSPYGGYGFPDTESTDGSVSEYPGGNGSLYQVCVGDSDSGPDGCHYSNGPLEGSVSALWVP